MHFGDPRPTLACLRSIAGLTYRPRVIVVVHSGGRAAALCQGCPSAEHEVVERNLGFAAAVNRGVARARATGAAYALVLNNDVELDAGAIEPLVRLCLDDRRIGVAGPIHYELARRQVVQNTGSFIRWSTGRVSTHGEGMERPALSDMPDPDFICGAGFFFPLRVFDRVGGLDERFFLYCEESDWCLRVRRAGYRIVRVPESKLFHAGGGAVGAVPGLYQYYATRNKLWLVRRWAPRSEAAAYVALHVLFRYPKMLVGRLLRLDQVGFRQTLRGIRDGFRGRA